MGDRRKRWRPWDLNRLAADITAEVSEQRKSALPRLMMKLPRRKRQPAQTSSPSPKPTSSSKKD